MVSYKIMFCMKRNKNAHFLENKNILYETIMYILPIIFIQNKNILYETINGAKYTRVILPPPFRKGDWENRH
jgi:hypothetical protein